MEGYNIPLESILNGYILVYQSGPQHECVQGCGKNKNSQVLSTLRCLSRPAPVGAMPVKQFTLHTKSDNDKFSNQIKTKSRS